MKFHTFECDKCGDDYCGTVRGDGLCYRCTVVKKAEVSNHE